MPTPPLTDAAMREALSAVEAHGSVTAAANALGIPRSSFQHRVAKAREKFGAGEGVAEALADLGMNGAYVRGGWLKSKSASIRFDMPRAEDDSLDRIRDAFEGMAPAAPVVAPAYANDELITVYGIADAHIGMLSWGRETGEDYDIAIALERVRSWVGRLVASSPASGTALILETGDLTHQQDSTNQTPRSKHVLDVDGRYFKTLEASITALATAVDLALNKHERVIVRILPGNHNQDGYLGVMFALAERYRNEPRVEVQKDPSEFFAMDWGKVLIAAHHGHGAKAQQMVMFLADQYAEQWGRTRWRYLFTGHLHHHKSQEFAGCVWEQLRAVAPRDAYAVGHAFGGRSEMQAITYDKQAGEIQRVKVAA